MESSMNANYTHITETNNKPNNNYPQEKFSPNMVPQLGLGSHTRSHSDFNSSKTPEKSQWALLNKQQALEYERIKALDKLKEQQKKQIFKQELDDQLNSKNSSRIYEKEEDKRYFNFILEKQSMAKRKDQEDKQRKIQNQQRIQESNYQANQHKKHNYGGNSNTLTGLPIGAISDEQRYERKINNRKQFVDALDKQLYYKDSQKRVQQIEDYKKNEENIKYQHDYDARNKRSKSYHQNPGVYQYYKRIDMEKKIKEKQLQQKLVNEARAKKIQAERSRQQEKQKKLLHLNSEVKSVLDDQIRSHEVRRSEERRTNPQEYSYSVMDNIFRDRSSRYDKKQYFQYLQKQAELQKHQKGKSNFMSDQEYRLNYNQLHKAVSGGYSFDQYIDRSVNMIGVDNKRTRQNYNTGGGVNDPDTNIVKMKIDDIKEHQQKKKFETEGRVGF